MFKRAKAAAVVITLMAASALAGPLEDFKSAGAALDAGDYNKALRLLQPLAKQGVPGAMYVLGVMYSEGKGVQKDYAAALAWHRQAADRGHTALSIRNWRNV
jgi:TPR repeat protein